MVRSGELGDDVVICATKYYRHYTVLQSTTVAPYYKELRCIAKFFSVLQSITPYYNVLQSITPYYKKLLHTIPYYKDYKEYFFLLHTRKRTHPYYKVLQKY